LLALARPWFGPQRSGWIALGGIASYAILVGGEAAVVRAAIMAGTFILAARLLGRPTFAPAGLFTAGLLMTLADPNILWDAGFQLSFAATLGLMLYAEPLARFTEGRLVSLTDAERARRLTRALADVVLATLAASLLTLPLIMATFGQLSLISPLANLLVLPAQPAVMLWGRLATVAGLIAPALGQPLAWVAWLFLTYTIELVAFLGRLPWAAVPVSVPPAAIVALYALTLGVTWLALRRPERAAATAAAIGQRLPERAVLVAGLLVAALAVAAALTRPDGRLHVAFLDVGQGDATLIETPGGRQILIDGGRYPAALSSLVGERLPF
jgi:competence protein ComEC